MKKKILLLFFISCFLSCNKKENQITSPLAPLLGTLSPTTSINAVYERLAQSETATVHFLETQPLWLTGYVISDDFSGNFYKEVYLQDSPENPKKGLRVLLDQTALSLRFPFGRKVYVRLNGLGAGKQNGMLSIGSYRPNGVGNIPNYLVSEVIVRSSETITPVPKTISPSEITNEHMGLWVSFEEVQTLKSEVDKTFAGEAYDQFNGERRLRSCKEGSTFCLSTSIYADFKSVLLPRGTGNITGLITRDFFDEKFIVKVNRPSDLQFTNSRCDGFFEVYFETAYLGKFIAKGWENIAVAGSRYWEIYEDKSSMGKSIKISAFGSGDLNSDSWLITPELDVSNLNTPVLQFSTSTVYPDRSSLKVYLVWDWKSAEELENTPKKLLDARIANRGDDNSLWIPSGMIPLPTDIGPIRIAFRYQGSGKSTYDGTFELDDIQIIDQQKE